MTDRDLGALLERASEHLPEVDFANGAWSAAVTERARRRRMAVGAVGALAAAGLAVTAVQLGGTTKPRPLPAVSATTPVSSGVLADGTAYALLPLEGKESQLREYDVGLPSTIDPAAKLTKLSTLGKPPESAVAVYLRQNGDNYQPVVVTGRGEQILADTVTLVPTRDRDGNTSAPLGPRAVAEGHIVFFPQPGKVVQLDTTTGDVKTYAVPSPYVEDVGWSPADSVVVIRTADRAWTLNPWEAGAKVVPADSTRVAGTATLGVTTDTRSLGITWTDPLTKPPAQQRSVLSPVTELAGDTLSSATWAASGAFFDQNLTSPVIRRGNGPIYQGLVAIPFETGRAQLLLAPENPDGQTGRFKGCCTVLGWANGVTVLLQSTGSHGSWVLAWDVTTDEVYRVTRIKVDPARQFVPALALNVGWRY